MESDQQKHPSSNEGTDLTLQDRLEQQKEWSRAVVYTSEGKILGTTFDVDLNEIMYGAWSQKKKKKKKKKMRKMQQLCNNYLIAIY